jgi:hypothetical protein
VTARGGCLCGAVRYEVQGELAPISICHCSVCRRLHGEAAAYTRCDAADLVLLQSRGLARYEHGGATYSFCSECGSQLFWEREGRGTRSITPGTLEEPTGLRVAHHIWAGSAGDWEVISDGLPAYPEGSSQPPRPA